MANSTKNKVKKHFDFYVKCFYDGIMPCNGLCSAVDRYFIDKKTFKLFKPTFEDFTKMVDEYELTSFLANLESGFWASGLPIDAAGIDRMNKFTPLRQTIVLFMAAINNEL